MSNFLSVVICLCLALGSMSCVKHTQNASRNENTKHELGTSASNNVDRYKILDWQALKFQDVCPDWEKEVVLQRGNTRTHSKIKLKSGAELSGSRINVLSEADLKSFATFWGIGVDPCAFGPIYKAIEKGLVQNADLIGWQFLCDDQSADLYKQYIHSVQLLKKAAVASGFKGKFAVIIVPAQNLSMAGEKQSDKEKSQVPCIHEAKCVSGGIIMHLGLQVMPYVVDVYGDHATAQQLPSPYHYVIKTLRTLMDGAEPTGFEVEFSDKNSRFNCYTFDLPGNRLGSGVMVAIWIDKGGAAQTNVLLKNITAGKVVAVDSLNGFEQDMDFTCTNKGVVVENLVIRDYPLMLKITGIVWVGHLNYN